jgi:hypothetical protein
MHRPRLRSSLTAATGTVGFAAAMKRPGRWVPIPNNRPSGSKKLGECRSQKEEPLGSCSSKRGSHDHAGLTARSTGTRNDSEGEPHQWNIPSVRMLVVSASCALDRRKEYETNRFDLGRVGAFRRPFLCPDDERNFGRDLHDHNHDHALSAGLSNPASCRWAISLARPTRASTFCIWSASPPLATRFRIVLSQCPLGG